MAPVAGAALIVLFCRQGTLAWRVLSHPAPVGIGLVSYSAYLVHQPLFAFARIRGAEEPGLALLGILSVASLGLGWLSWRFIELPFRGQRAAVMPDRRVFGTVFAGIAAVLVAGAVIVRMGDGYPTRVTERFAGDIGHAPFYRYAEARFYACTPASLRKAAPVFDDRPRCFQSQPELPVTVAVVGDSHAEHLFAGVAEHLPEDVVAIYLQNAVPFRSDPLMRGIYTELGRNKHLKAVVFAMHWPRRYNEFGDAAAFRTELGATLSYLKGLDVAVVVAGDLPWFASEPPTCKYEVFPGNLRYCTVERSDAIEARHRYGPIVADVTSDLGIPLVPLRDVFCDGDACSMVRDEIVQYRDSNHLNRAGSDAVGAKISAELRTLLRRSGAPPGRQE
jgi:hypothetical protein